MSSYLGDIVQYVRNLSYLDFHDSVYMGNDINAIDTAYSDVENHKFTIFFVPEDTATTTSGTGLPLETKYFKAYMFIPVEDDVSATDGWELAQNIGGRLTAQLRTYNGLTNKIKYLGGRDFRVGRGYYIYVLSYSVDILIDNVSPGGDMITYFNHTGEIDGSATYTKRMYANTATNEKFALSRMVNGIYRAFGCEVIVGTNGNQLLDPTDKDWFVMGWLQDNTITTKQQAMDAGWRVYEVNQWEVYYGETSSTTKIGIRLVGV